MKLTGIIIFFGALLGLLFWIYKVVLFLGSREAFIKIHMNEELAINIMPGIILFLVMAISAGMAWG